eukprot:TRINITY_DN11854_c0_g2_i1.p1 TRINITY_DN11854_c0_g2~~TRINITY_DN11854_c0_g2_i1.p1  ORF type:complete len:438 (-),score=79.82 TRINITY_DN11854_c0_g2_i1:189-1502(-)
MPVQAPKTADFLKSVCNDIGHEEGVACITKKIVHDKLVVSLADLKSLPFEQLEDWGLPLKLIAHIVDKFKGDAATEYYNSVQSKINYGLRPAMARMQSNAVNLLQKNAKPEEWAVLKLQRAYRRKKARLAAEEKEAERLAQAEEEKKLLEDLLDDDDFQKLDDDAAFELRKKRAIELIRSAVRGWKDRRRLKLEGKVPARLGDAFSNTVKAAKAQWSLTRMPDVTEPVKDCEVSTLLREIGVEQLGLPEDDVTSYAHRIVTLNWIEEAEDLDFIEPRHWQTWKVPPALANKVRERRRSALTRLLGAIGTTLGKLTGRRLCFEDDNLDYQLTDENTDSIAEQSAASTGGRWFCGACTTRNDASVSECKQCKRTRNGALKPTKEAAAAPVVGSVQASSRMRRASRQQRKSLEAASPEASSLVSPTSGTAVRVGVDEMSF